VSELAVITPTWAPDAEQFAELHRSVLEHTPETTVHHAIVPWAHRSRFTRFSSERCRIWHHPELLPRRYVRMPGGIWVNSLRPWPPVRGWVMQQAAKIAAAARLDADVVLLADSDAILVRPTTASSLMSSDKVVLYRADDAVHDGMPRHVLWHGVARRLLGLPAAPPPPLPDYVGPFGVWDPAMVRAMQQRIAETTGRSWLDAFTGELHISEFIVYGVFMDQVIGTPPLVDKRFCHNYYERTPLSTESAVAFADRMSPEAIGIMISSHSGTPREVRLAAARRCAERIG
jgi:hypothetical protein